MNCKTSFLRGRTSSRLCLILFFLCPLSRLAAQQITGTIVDEKQQPLPYASIILLNVPDSAYVAGVSSRHDGSFELPAQQGKEYILSVSYTGLKTVYKPCRAGEDCTLVLWEDAELLQEVVVMVQRTVHDATGYTTNLRSSDIVKGKQSSDALAFLPGITKEEGTFKINGVTVSDISIDGVSVTALDELDNLPADVIDKVKVNYLAGNNQNADISGGTIDIILRKPPQGGYYGALSAGAKYHIDYDFSDENIGGVIYYRYKNLSVYDNFSVKGYQYRETAKQSIEDLSTNLLTLIREESENNGFAFNNRLSLTQQINSRNQLGGSYYIASNRRRPASSTVQDALQAELNGHDNVLNQEVTLKYTTQLNDKGSELEVAGDYFFRNADTDSHHSGGNGTESKAADKTTLDLWKFSISLTQPLSKKLSLKFGAFTQIISSKYNPEDLENSNGSHETSIIPTRTKGLTPHAYVQAMGTWWKLRYSAGVNWQLNRIEYEALDNTGEKFRDTKWGINPLLQVMMPLGKRGKHALMLNYKHALGDIPYAAISSTINWSDPYNYTTGNPDLRAPTTDMLLADISLFGNKLTITTLYIHANNTIHWGTKRSLNNPEVFYTMPINLPSIDAFGLGAEVNLNPLKAWRAKLSGRLEISPEDLTLSGVCYNKTRLKQYYSFNNNFNFANGWGGTLNAMLEPTFKKYDRTYHTVYNISGQVYKSLSKDKIQLTLTVDALGNRRRLDRICDQHKVVYDYTTSVQSFSLSVVWRFSGGKKVQVNATEGIQNYQETKDDR